MLLVDKVSRFVVMRYQNCIVNGIISGVVGEFQK